MKHQQAEPHKNGGTGSGAPYPLPDGDLVHQQAMKYGHDMAEIYKQERAKRQALEVAYKKLEGALESMSDGFLVVDRELNVVEINKACADLFDLEVVTTLGKPLSDLLVGNDAPEFCNQLAAPAPKKLTYQLDILMPIPRSLLIHAAPLPDEGWVLVLHDVTWEERVNNMREEFLNLAAHELRTPLAGIIGFTSLLEQIAQEREMPAESWMVLQNILKSAERLRRTITDLLDFTTNDSTVRLSLTDLRAILKEAIGLLEHKAETHGVTVHLVLPDERMTVYCDGQMLSTAVAHLIENGIKYNKAGGSLTIKAEIKPDRHVVTFSDTGIGISKKDLAYVFRPFFQVEEHTTRRSVGMGLGLSIAQRIVMLHQGTLSGRSQLKKGSVFTLTLPQFSAENMGGAKREYLRIQRNLRSRARRVDVNDQTQQLISQLKSQLERTQSQNLAYAADLAKLYRLQRADAEALRAKEARINHTDRLALMGQLAAGVAHDLSNLIGPILGYSQIILKNRDSINPQMAEIIERILGTSRRANILLRQMVTLSANRSEEFEAVDLTGLIEDMLLMLEIKMKHANIDLVEAFAPDLAPVYAHSVQISQVILNLLVNAIDAMETGGVLTVKTASKEIDGCRYGQIQISDTGDGIQPEHLPYIFDAFFTTKDNDSQSGTGLGLAVSQEIVKKHGGQIRVESTPGKGAIFTVLLPHHQEAGT